MTERATIFSLSAPSPPASRSTPIARRLRGQTGRHDSSAYRIGPQVHGLSSAVRLLQSGTAPTRFHNALTDPRSRAKLVSAPHYERRWSGLDLIPEDDA